MGDKFCPLFYYILMEEFLQNYVNELLADSEHFLVEIDIKGGKAKPKFFIYLDGINGIPIEKCADVSRKVGNKIEELDLISTPYNLEVSSPGLDNPLKDIRQFTKNIGRNADFYMEDGRSFQAKIANVIEDRITLERAKESEEVNFSDINKAKIIISF